MDSIINKSCCFTGHRKIDSDEYTMIVEKLELKIIELIENGIIYFRCGGALGFDTLVAKLIIDLKIKYPYIKLVLILPCIEQTKWWKEEDKEIYKYIIDNSDEVLYTSKNYFRGCMFKRNRMLVDESRFCICYLTKNNGGTFYTVNYAKEKGLIVYNVAK